MRGVLLCGVMVLALWRRSVLAFAVSRALGARQSPPPDTLIVSLDTTGTAFVPETGWSCDKLNGFVFGSNTPLHLDAIRTPYPVDTAAQVVLAHVGDYNDTALGKKVSWQVQLDEGAHFRWRLSDSTGAVVYSEAALVLRSSLADKECTNNSGLAGVVIVIFVSILGTVALIAFIAWRWSYLVARKDAAAAALARKRSQRRARAVDCAAEVEAVEPVPLEPAYHVKGAALALVESCDTDSTLYGSVSSAKW
ncbi:hypothetical protein JCM3770_001403 [Rhodotorula araucariae]